MRQKICRDCSEIRRNFQLNLLPVSNIKEDQQWASIRRNKSTKNVIDEEISYISSHFSKLEWIMMDTSHKILARILRLRRRRVNTTRAWAGNSRPWPSKIRRQFNLGKKFNKIYLFYSPISVPPPPHNTVCSLDFIKHREGDIWFA